MIETLAKVVLTKPLMFWLFGYKMIFFFKTLTCLKLLVKEKISETLKKARKNEKKELQWKGIKVKGSQKIFKIWVYFCFKRTLIILSKVPAVAFISFSKFYVFGCVHKFDFWRNIFLETFLCFVLLCFSFFRVEREGIGVKFLFSKLTS